MSIFFPQKLVGIYILAPLCRMCLLSECLKIHSNPILPKKSSWFTFQQFFFFYKRWIWFSYWHLIKTGGVSASMHTCKYISFLINTIFWKQYNNELATTFYKKKLNTKCIDKWYSDMFHNKNQERLHACGSVFYSTKFWIIS